MAQWRTYTYYAQPQPKDADDDWKEYMAHDNAAFVTASLNEVATDPTRHNKRATKGPLTQPK